MKSEGHVKVIVVGGGAAGLAAAVAAEQAGLSCQLLEAQDRLGGRVRTLPLQSGGLFDAGAQMVNGDMTALLTLAERADLHLSPIPQTGRNASQIMRNEAPEKNRRCPATIQLTAKRAKTPTPTGPPPSRSWNSPMRKIAQRGIRSGR